MSTDQIDPSKKDASISSADNLVKSSDVELTEEELKRVSGGKDNLRDFKFTQPVDKATP